MFDTHTVDSALAVLSAALHDPACLALACKQLVPTDFLPVAHRPCFEVLLALHRASGPVNFQTLRTGLTRNFPGLFTGSSGPAVLRFLTDLHDQPAPDPVAFQLAIFTLQSARTGLVALAARISALAADPALSAAQAYTAICRLVLDAGAQSPSASQSPAAGSLLTARALYDRPDTAPLWLLDRLLLAGGVNLLAGEVASGKTFLALDLALSIASIPAASASDCALAWDARPCLTGPVLYCCQDSAPRTIRSRLHALCAGRSLPPPDALFFEFSPLNLAAPADLKRLQSIIRAQHVVLVILDVLARYLPGLDENSVSSVGPVFTALRSASVATGAAFLVIHHFNKSASFLPPTARMHRVRGSSDIIAAVDAALSVTLSGTRAQPRRTITPEKNRELPEGPPFDFSIQPAAVPGSLLLQFSSRTVLSSVPTPLEHLLALLQSDPSAAFTRSDLQQRLIDSGHKLKIGALNRLFADLATLPHIDVERQGLLKSYRFIASSQ